MVAISKKDEGKYIIDAVICNNCENLMDMECIRVCAPNAITREDGTAVQFDATWRVRPEHLIWMMALLASRGAQDEGKYSVGNPQWDQKRKLVSSAFLNPDFKIRLTRSYDDICLRCGAKQEPGHPEVSGGVDDLCYKELGITPGTVMKLWDVVKMIEEKFSLAFIKTLSPIPDDILADILKFASPDAKMLTNDCEPT
jgi:hypothetical protein